MGGGTSARHCSSTIQQHQQPGYTIQHQDRASTSHRAPKPAAPRFHIGELRVFFPYDTIYPEQWPVPEQSHGVVGPTSRKRGGSCSVVGCEDPGVWATEDSYCKPPCEEVFDGSCHPNVGTTHSYEQLGIAGTSQTHRTLGFFWSTIESTIMIYCSSSEQQLFDKRVLYTMVLQFYTTTPGQHFCFKRPWKAAGSGVLILRNSGLTLGSVYSGPSIWKNFSVIVVKSVQSQPAQLFQNMSHGIS